MISRFKTIFMSMALFFAIGMSSTACADDLSSKPQMLTDGVEVLGLEACEFKGLTSFLFAVKLRSTTNTEYSMEGGEVVLLLARDTVAVMKQNGVATLAPHAEGVVESLWNIERIDPMNMMLLSMQMAKQDYKGMNISYRVIFREGRKSREMSKKNLDLEKFMSIFAPTILPNLMGS